MIVTVSGRLHLRVASLACTSRAEPISAVSYLCSSFLFFFFLPSRKAKAARSGNESEFDGDGRSRDGGSERSREARRGEATRAREPRGRGGMQKCLIEKRPSEREWTRREEHRYLHARPSSSRKGGSSVD